MFLDCLSAISNHGLFNGNQCRQTCLSYSKSKNSLLCVPSNCQIVYLNFNEKNMSKLVLDGFINWKKCQKEYQNIIILISIKKAFVRGKGLKCIFVKVKVELIPKELQIAIKL